jgi:hypothetical protein
MAVRSAVLKLCAAFSDMQHSHHAITMHLYQLVLNSEEGKYFSPIRTESH